MEFDLNDFRHEFTQKKLNRSELNHDPFKQFKVWLMQANKVGIVNPNAMSLATSDNCEVGIRTVLLKHFDSNGFVFFSNYNSKKAQQILFNSNVALLFPWLALERQVNISGRVVKISRADSLEYFSSRSRNAQLGAWASSQSSSLPSRQVLLDKFKSVQDKFHKNTVSLPDFWGGYCVIPETIEFWQGRKNRLHDRFIYQKNNDKWLIKRLSP